MSTLSLDGHRLAGEINVRFSRSVSPEAAEAFADEVASATAEILGDQICQGEVPLSRTELETKIRGRLRGPLTRWAEIHIASLNAVPAGGAARSTYRSRESRPNLSTPPPAATERPSNPPPARDSSRPEPKSAIESPFRMLWQHSLSNLQATASVEQIAGRLGPPLRDSTAAAVYRILSAVDPAAMDRFALLDGRPPAPELRLETCACFAACMHRVLVQGSIDPPLAMSLSANAARRALFPDASPVAHVDRYIASNGPVRELSYKAASLLGVPADAAHVLSALAPYCEALRAELDYVVKELRRFEAHRSNSPR